MRLAWKAVWMLAALGIAISGQDTAPPPSPTPAAPPSTPAPPPPSTTPGAPPASTTPASSPAQPATNAPSVTPKAADASANAPINFAEDQDQEECEEAWEYLEFLKKMVKEKIEKILQDTLFEQKPLKEQVVTDTMSQTLEIRDAVLNRMKAIRTNSGEVKICPGQGVNQEQFLAQLRMDIMSVLLKLIEPGAVSAEKLQDIGRDLLAIRTRVNGEITRIIMLRESGVTTTRASEGTCDCGILDEIVIGLDSIIMKQKETDKANENADGKQAEAGVVDPVSNLTMILMMVDNRIGLLYNDILGALDEEKRQKASEELTTLKDISADLNEQISKMVTYDPETDDGARKIQRSIDRDITKLRNDVERQLQKCRQNCPTDCKSCGAEKIDEIARKLSDYKGIIADLEDEESRDSIRTDLMQFLAKINEDMTKLLTTKAERDGNITECEMEQLDAMEKFKGPLWMLVNVTIFRDEQMTEDMINAIETVLKEMRSQFCSAEPRTIPTDPEKNECDQDEINNTAKWIGEIDTIISENIFKSVDNKGKLNAMLGFIELKSGMDDRVRQLFQDNLRCKEEAEQIKNKYMGQITRCLAEMMSPKYDFVSKNRGERVQCIKELRVQMEERRGELLLREVERRISAANLDASRIPEDQVETADRDEEVVAAAS